MYNIKTEFQTLVKNGWLTEEQAKIFINDENIQQAIKFSTSPSKENIFNALKMLSVNEVKVVILGKDPYPNPKDAHGLAFSSKNDITPDSLKNIFKAIDSTYNSNLFEKKQNDLTNWAKQGVLLLNTGLTFQKVEDNSEQTKIQNRNMKIWKPFVKIILSKLLAVTDSPLVMLLWGNDAQNIVFSLIKDKNFRLKNHSRDLNIIPNTKILILQASHPSPLSVNRGGDFPYIAPKHFKACNDFLSKNKINWTNL